MAAPLRLKARAPLRASRSGPVYLGEPPAIPRFVSHPAVSGRRESLAAAIETAIDELQNLATGSGREGGDIIDFQLEVLHDPTIAEATACAYRCGRECRLRVGQDTRRIHP